jgi:hypothetical protein
MLRSIRDEVVFPRDGEERVDASARRVSRLFRPWLTFRRKVSGARSGAFLGYLAIQALIVVGLVTPRFPTSAEYLRLDFTGRQPRLWTVPLFYKLLPTDSLRVAGQVVLAAVCWWVLASVASSMVHDRRVRIGLRLVILALGVIGPIAQWNSAIGDESVTISLTALLIAAWLWYVRRPRVAAAVWVVTATTFWTFTRQDHVIMTALIAVVVLACVVLARITKTRRSALTGFVAIFLVVVSTLGFWTASRDRSLENVNLTAIIASRVLTNSTYELWFNIHGMPDTPAIRSYAGSVTPEALGSNGRFAKWVAAHGEHTYVQFLVTHLRYTLALPLLDITGKKPTQWVPAPQPRLQPDLVPSFVSPNANWAFHRDVLPGFLQDLLFAPGQSADVISLGAVAIGLALVARRRKVADRRLLVPTVVLATVVPHIYLVWLTSATELDRHALIIAVSLRIAIWLMAAYALDVLLAAPPAPPPITNE